MGAIQVSVDKKQSVAVYFSYQCCEPPPPSISLLTPTVLLAEPQLVDGRILSLKLI